MSPNYRTGGEIDAWCTKCRMVLAHTIVAMVGSKPVRVQCNTCGGVHNYRSGAQPEARPAKAASATTAASRAASTRAARQIISFDELIASKTREPRNYTPKAVFSVDDVIVHPTFGRGFVSAVRSDKIDVTFRTEVKTLVHGK